MYPYEMRCSLAVRLQGYERSRLSVEWSVANLSAHRALPFAAALHTYFHVSDISHVAVTAARNADSEDNRTPTSEWAGLKGVAYVDQLREKAVFREDNSSVRFDGEVDRVYLQAPEHMVIVDRDSGGKGRELHVIKSSGALPDAVVWNPWVRKTSTLADMAPLGFRTMVCVESCAVGADFGGLAIAAGDSWHARMLLYATPLGDAAASV